MTSYLRTRELGGPGDSDVPSRRTVRVEGAGARVDLDVVGRGFDAQRRAADEFVARFLGDRHEIVDHAAEAEGYVFTLRRRPERVGHLDDVRHRPPA